MFGRTDAEQAEIDKRNRSIRRELDRREENVMEREKDVEHKIELVIKNRNHQEALATIARQDQKLEEDHKRRIADLEKERAQIELDHEHRMELLKAEEDARRDEIALLEASNAKELAHAEERVARIQEAHQQVLQAKNEQILSLRAQFEMVVGKLMEKLPNVNVNDITIVPQGGQGKGGEQKKDNQTK